MQRINDISKKKEDEQKQKLVLDKDSSARIIKRSLWQMVQKQDTLSSIEEDINVKRQKTN